MNLDISLTEALLSTASVAAGAFADLEHDVLLVVRVLRQQQ